jgi:hypothetical protein
LSDEDENGNRPAGATTPDEVRSEFHRIWGLTEKQLLVYGIVIKPGDADCLDKQKYEYTPRWLGGGESSYGTAVAELVTQTGGQLGSICDGDFAQSLTEMGRNINSTLTRIDLKATPKKDSVEIQFTPEANRVPFTVQNRTVIFARAVAPGTELRIRYEPIE